MSAKYVPPANFAPVEQHLYRSAAPRPINFPFLKLLDIKTIIWLNVEDPSDELLDFIDAHDINLEHLGLLTKKVKPWDPISDKVVQEALTILMNIQIYPVLICCSMGRHRTGAVIGCLRKLQGWSFASLVDEYQRFTGIAGERSNVELLVENFSLVPLKQLLKIKANSNEPVPQWFDLHNDLE